MTVLSIIALILGVLSFIVSLCSFIIVYTSLKRISVTASNISSSVPDFNFDGLLASLLGDHDEGS